MTNTTIFKYEENLSCACGASLSGSFRYIEKDYCWGSVNFVQCSDCSSWNQSPRITTGTLSLWYNSDNYRASGQLRGGYFDYDAEEKGRQKEAESRYESELAQLLLPESRVLEVGCATGSLLSVIKENGHAVDGVDLSSKFADQAMMLYGLDVSVSDFLNFKCEAEHYDLIIMMGTLSNLQEPFRHLEHAYRLLKPGGWFYANFPGADSAIAKLYGAHYWMFAPSVVSFFSKKGCRRSLRRAGFTHIRICNDHQRPTVAKLLAHSGLRRLYPFAERLKIGI